MAAIRWNMTSYDTVRSEILARAAQGLGYDFDGYYGYQCWDLGANLYWNAGRGTFRTKNSFTGAGGIDSYVSTTWTYPQAFQANSEDPFMAITNVNEIKRGDMVIWQAGGTIDASGHNAFADEDYNNGKTEIRALGQNQGKYWGPEGHFATLNNIQKSGILGAFRYKPWNGSGPEPPEPPIGGIVTPRGSRIVILKKALQLRNKRV